MNPCSCDETYAFQGDTVICRQCGNRWPLSAHTEPGCGSAECSWCTRATPATADRDPSKATRATLEALAEAVEQQEGIEHYLSPNVERALAAYRSEIRPKLRSRAEVDAEIVSVCRLKRPQFPWLTQGLADDLSRLISEPTTHDPSPAPKMWGDTRAAERSTTGVICSQCLQPFRRKPV